MEDQRGWLSDAEQQRRKRFRREEDAQAFTARRMFLRQVLAGYLDCAPAEICFEEGACGKPALALSRRAGIEFSLSRSAGWILLGVAREREMGVDVERVHPRLDDEEELSRLAGRVLTASERGALERCPAQARPAAFVRAWTRKEAVLKALGVGLSREPASVEVGLEALGPDERRRLHAKNFPRERGALLVDLVAPPGFAAALVAEGRDWHPVLIRPEALCEPRSAP